MTPNKTTLKKEIKYHPFQEVLIVILVLADVHSKKSSLQSILDRIEKNKVKGIILAGDLTSYGSEGGAMELIEMLSFSKLFAVPGNLDSQSALKAMEKSGVSVHGKKRKLENKSITGMGGGLTGGPGEILFSEKEIEKKLSGLVEKNSILVTHLPPKNSALDSVNGKNIGSKAVRRIIQEKKPSLHLCGHVHESRNIEQINKTLCINPGPAKEGNAALVRNVKQKKAELI